MVYVSNLICVCVYVFKMLFFLLTLFLFFASIEPCSIECSPLACLNNRVDRQIKEGYLFLITPALQSAC